MRPVAVRGDRLALFDDDAARASEIARATLASKPGSVEALIALGDAERIDGRGREAAAAYAHVDMQAKYDAKNPAALRQLVGALPGGLMAPVGEAISEALAPCDARQLQRNLEQLLTLSQAGPYLVGDRLSLADLAVVAQLSLLRFPAGAGAPLAGRGLPGLSDNPLLAPLFQWQIGRAHV